MYGMMLVFFLSINHLNGIEKLEDPSTQLSFPRQIKLPSGVILEATGVATRYKFMVKVYSIAHYLQDPHSGTIQEALKQVFDDNKIKQFTMHWVRDVDLRKIRETFWESFERVLIEEDYDKLSKEIDQFVNLYDRDALKNSVHELRWLPEGVIELYIEGQLKGSIKSLSFAKALWDIWLGPKSVVDRDKLVSLFVHET